MNPEIRESMEHMLVVVEELAATFNEFLDAESIQLNLDDVGAALRASLALWTVYPLKRGKLFAMVKIPVRIEPYSSQIDLIEQEMSRKLDENHKDATDVLTSQAEHYGLDSSLIKKAASYCRELLADKQHEYVTGDRWNKSFPDCFGDSLELPMDVRQAMIDGDAEVKRLVVKVSLKVSAPLWTADEEKEARRMISEGVVTKATDLCGKLGIRRTVELELFRHITNKPKKARRRN